MVYSGVYQAVYNALYQDPYGVTGSAAAWTPALWFLASEQGIWLDPSDFTRYMGEKGPELSEDPDFNDTTKWGKGSGWSVSGGQAVHNGAAADYVNSLFDPVVGKTYEYVVDVAEVPAGSSVMVYVNGVSGPAWTTPGIYRTAIFCSQPGVGAIKHSIRASNSTGQTTRINSFSIKEVTSATTATLFQDSAGATPVTAVEQVVGKILDKSGRGNHATQATTASKPKLSARKNLLLATTTLATQSYTMLAAQATLSFKGTGTVTLSGASTAGPLVGTGAGNRVSLTFTPTAGSVTFTVSGSVTEAQLEYGASATTYQRVTTSTDYDTVGFPHYLKFDGVDDFLSTGNIDATGVDSITVMAGVLKNNRTATGDIISFTADPGVTNGSWLLTAPAFSNSDSVGWGSRGTAYASNNENSAPYGIGYKGTLTGTADISLDSCILRSNGTQLFSTATNQGTGGYANAPIYVGRRGGTAASFNGNLYQLAARFAATADLTPGETFFATKL